MSKYKIIKESKALPVNAKVGATIYDDGIIELTLSGCRGNVGKVSREHLAALLELGVVEEAKEWNPRELKDGDKYFTVTRQNRCTIMEKEEWMDCQADRFLRATGNCHPTKEAAERWRDELIKKYENNTPEPECCADCATARDAIKHNYPWVPCSKHPTQPVESKKQWVPMYGETYYIPIIDWESSTAFRTCWGDHGIHTLRLKRGLVCQTEDEAREMALKMLAAIKK